MPQDYPYHEGAFIRALAIVRYCNRINNRDFRITGDSLNALRAIDVPDTAVAEIKTIWGATGKMPRDITDKVDVIRGWRETYYTIDQYLARYYNVGREESLRAVAGQDIAMPSSLETLTKIIRCSDYSAARHRSALELMQYARDYELPALKGPHDRWYVHDEHGQTKINQMRRIAIALGQQLDDTSTPHQVSKSFTSVYARMEEYAKFWEKRQPSLNPPVISNISPNTRTTHAFVQERSRAQERLIQILTGQGVIAFQGTVGQIRFDDNLHDPWPILFGRKHN